MCSSYVATCLPVLMRDLNRSRLSCASVSVEAVAVSRSEHTMITRMQMITPRPTLSSSNMRYIIMRRHDNERGSKHLVCH